MISKNRTFSSFSVLIIVKRLEVQSKKNAETPLNPIDVKRVIPLSQIPPPGQSFFSRNKKFLLDKNFKSLTAQDIAIQNIDYSQKNLANEYPFKNQNYTRSSLNNTDTLYKNQNYFTASDSPVSNVNYS